MNAAMVEDQPFPAGPHEDGTLLIDFTWWRLYFWNANTNQWVAVVRYTA